MRGIKRRSFVAISVVLALVAINGPVQEVAQQLGVGKVDAASAAPGVVPAGFRDERVAGGSDLPAQFRLSYPTGMAFLPDGRILVAEKGGKLKVIKSGLVQATPVFDLSAQVYTDGDGGLIGVTPDPQFSTNGYIYVTYKSDNPREGRVSRFTMSGDSAALSTEVVLLRTTADNDSHQIDSVKVGVDGYLYATTGDSSSFDTATISSTRSQQADQTVGKLFRMTKDGKGLSDNPFWTGNADDAASKVYAVGLRNAFRFTVRPNGTVILGDVGWNSAEEVNTVVPGVGNHNYGWPCYEGSTQRSEFASFPVCQTLNAKGSSAVTAPNYSYSHDVGSSITGGPVYDGTAFPAQYRNAYFFGDYSHNWIKYWPMDANGNFVGQPQAFATVTSPVDLQMGSDGALYYVDINDGQVRRIAYGTTTSCAAGNYFAQYYKNTTWTGTPAMTRCDDVINYNWAQGGPFGATPVDNYSVQWSGQQYFSKGSNTVSATSDDGTQVWVDGTLVIDNNGIHPAQQKTATVTYTSAGFHTVLVKYYEATGDASAVVTISSANKAPTPVITTPKDGGQFSSLQGLSASGSGSDPEDGALTGNSLRWDVILHHCPPPSGASDVCHTHPDGTFFGTSGTFTGLDTSGDWQWLEVKLTATDSAGASTSKSVQIFPNLCAVGSARAWYYPSQNWTGTPTKRCDTSINNNWGQSGPISGRNDNYSIEWHWPTYFAAGMTSVNVNADDGALLYIDGELAIDNNGIHAAVNKTKLVNFATAGYHDVYLRYYEATGDAVAELHTTGSCAAGSYLGLYYKNTNWSGTPALTRCDSAINFNWGQGGPFGATPVDNYSVEWYGSRNFVAGNNTMTVGSDDGEWLWVDGTPVLDNSGVHAYATKQFVLAYGSAGLHSIKVRYNEIAGDARALFTNTP